MIYPAEWCMWERQGAVWWTTCWSIYTRKSPAPECPYCKRPVRRVPPGHSLDYANMAYGPHGAAHTARHT